MGNTPFEQLKSTLNISEVSKLVLDYNTRFVSSSPILDNFYRYIFDIAEKRPQVKDILPAINIYLDYAAVNYAQVILRGKKKILFHLDLIYKSQPDKQFEAFLAPHHNMNYPTHISNYNEWQLKLRELLRRLDV